MTKAAMNGSEKDGNGVYGSRGEQVHSFYFILFYGYMLTLFALFRPLAPMHHSISPLPALFRPFSTLPHPRPSRGLHPPWRRSIRYPTRIT